MDPCDSAGKFTVVGRNVSAGPLVGLVSVPLRVMDCGLPAALSAKMSAACRKPATDGVNDSVAIHDAAGAMGAAVQLLDGALKSAGLLPPRLMAEIFRGAFPELVRVTLSGKLVDPFDGTEKFKMPGVNVTAGAGGGAPSPAPVSGTDCGLPGALSSTVNCARREPDAVGVKFSVMRQEVLRLSTVGALQLSISVKSAAFKPVILMALTLRAWSPVLESKRDCVGAAIPMVLLPNIKFAGVSVATGPTTGCPEPGATLNAMGRPKPGAVKQDWIVGVRRMERRIANLGVGAGDGIHLVHMDAVIAGGEEEAAFCVEDRGKAKHGKW